MTAKSKSALMAKMRAERAKAGLKQVTLWIPATAAVERALKRLEGADGDSIVALIGDNLCSGCGEYSPFSERSGPDATCKECAAAEYRKLLNT